MAERNSSNHITAFTFSRDSEIKSIFSDASYQIDSASNKIDFTVRGTNITAYIPSPITQVFINE